ncbi:MAG: NADH-quinone oxidoreductase subunit C [Elusimicrobiota bacterium]|nr:NADH-quinone oxidoreductase subunit C [Elusimicrobiota bacterium]
MAEEILARIKDEFSKKILKVFEKSSRRIYIDFDAKDIPEVVSFLFREMGGRLATATGIDTRKNIEILYHFSFDSSGTIISLRTLIDKKNPEIESVTPIIKGAEWIEREMHELLGVNFRNHPNLKRLLLPEDWPERKYPLRRE